MTATGIDRAGPRDGQWQREFMSLARRALLGAAAGGAAGMVVGGIGGRVAMLVLRMTSPDRVLGVETDDGFEIGVVTIDTLNLLLATGALGAIAGLFVAWALTFMPWRWASWAWAAPGASLGGAVLISSDGVDFTILEPAWLAVGMFIIIPALGLLATALLIRRWESWWWANRRRTGLAIVAAWPMVAVPPAGLAVVASAAAWALLSRREAVRLLPETRPVQMAAAAAFAGVTLAFVPALIGDMRAVL